jgi:hypothetical protein
VRGGVGAGQHGRRPRAPTFKSRRDGVTGRAASRVVTPHAPSRALARSRVGSAGAVASGLGLGGASWTEAAASGRSRILAWLTWFLSCCLGPPEPVKGWRSGGGWRKRARSWAVRLRLLLGPAPPSLRLSRAGPALRTLLCGQPPSKARRVSWRSQLF